MAEVHCSFVYLVVEPTLNDPTQVTSSSMTVSWTALSGGGGDTQTYYVAAQNKHNSSEGEKACSSAGTSCPLSDLSALSLYTITVKSCATSNESFCGQPSDPKEKSTLPGSMFRIIIIKKQLLGSITGMLDILVNGLPQFLHFPFLAPEVPSLVESSVNSIKVNFKRVAGDKGRTLNMRHLVKLDQKLK